MALPLSSRPSGSQYIQRSSTPLAVGTCLYYYSILRLYMHYTYICWVDCHYQRLSVTDLLLIGPRLFQIICRLHQSSLLSLSPSLCELQQERQQYSTMQQVLLLLMSPLMLLLLLLLLLLPIPHEALKCLDFMHLLFQMRHSASLPSARQHPCLEFRVLGFRV